MTYFNRRLQHLSIRRHMNWPKYGKIEARSKTASLRTDAPRQTNPPHANVQLQERAFPTKPLLIANRKTEQKCTCCTASVNTRDKANIAQSETCDKLPCFYFFVSLKSNVLFSPALTMAVNVVLVLYFSGIGSLYPGSGGASRGVSIVTLFSPTFAPLALSL